jgi:hypothetical protein
MPVTQQPTEAGSVARAYFEAVAARDLDAMTGFYEPGEPVRSTVWSS